MHKQMYQQQPQLNGPMLYIWGTVLKGLCLVPPGLLMTHISLEDILEEDTESQTD